MAERVFYAGDKAPFVNPDEYLSLSDEVDRIVCLSLRDIHVINRYLWPFSEWRTRFSRPYTNNRRQESTSSEFAEYQLNLSDLSERLGEAGMTSCGDGLLAISQALLAIANKPCCNDSVNVTVNGGVVSGWQDDEGINHPIYGSFPPATNDGETPPGGFETYEDYLSNKCQLANLVFDGWLLTLRGFSGFTVFNATALATLIGLSLGPMIIFPPAAIPVAIGALIVLGSFVVMFEQICDSLEENREQIVCELYNSDTVESMTAVLADAIDAAVSLLNVSTPIGAALTTVALLVVNSDTLSQLMSGVAGASYPDADCSACSGCIPEVESITGLGEISGNELTLTLAWVQGEGQYRVDVYLRDAGDLEQFCGKWLTHVSSSGITDSGQPPIYELWGNGNSVMVYSSDTPPSQAYSADAITIRSGTAGTVVFEMSTEEPN